VPRFPDQSTKSVNSTATALPRENSFHRVAFVTRITPARTINTLKNDRKALFACGEIIVLPPAVKQRGNRKARTVYRVHLSIVTEIIAPTIARSTPAILRVKLQRLQAKPQIILAFLLHLVSKINSSFSIVFRLCLSGLFFKLRIPDDLSERWKNSLHGHDHVIRLTLEEPLRRIHLQDFNNNDWFIGNVCSLFVERRDVLVLICRNDFSFRHPLHAECGVQRISHSISTTPSGKKGEEGRRLTD